MTYLYPYIKMTHIILIIITFILFNIRFWQRTIYPQKSLPKLVNILPHINDSLILFSGMFLLHLGKWQPFGVSKWLGIKFLLVIVYIVLGIICLKATSRSNRWYIAYALAMISFAIIVYLARFKPIF